MALKTTGPSNCVRSSSEFDDALASDTLLDEVDSKTRKGISFVMLASPPTYTADMLTPDAQGAIADDSDIDRDETSLS